MFFEQFCMYLNNLLQVILPLKLNNFGLECAVHVCMHNAVFEDTKDTKCKNFSNYPHLLKKKKLNCFFI